MKKTAPIAILAVALMAVSISLAGQEVRLSKSALLDKIKGGWAGQVIGCTFGAPTEFGWKSTWIQDYQPLGWTGASIPATFKNRPGTYDDVYMEITFVRVLEKEGWNAPAASFAAAFANAPYPLWHANQMARYNILHGLMPPASGDWRNNPHADDIDFQIEADFAGLSAPGLPSAAAELCDRVGHVMNSGDGWYGGVFVAALYSLAFVETDVHCLVERALAVIPASSGFARMMADVVAAAHAEPDDWKAAWFRILRTWGEDIGCPEGVFSSFNIDAKINAAWVVLGLLYGNGDYGKTLEVATRCGDDSDCNPATAGGILGTILGYDRIPARWKAGLDQVEAVPFPYTDLSMSGAYAINLEIALKTLQAHGAKISGSDVVWAPQDPKPVRVEENFPRYRPLEKRLLMTDLTDTFAFEFEGIAFAVDGEATRTGKEDRVFRLEVTIDGKIAETVDLPTAGHDYRPTLCWAYELPAGRHAVRLRLLNPDPAAVLRLQDIVVFGRAPRRS